MATQINILVGIDSMGNNAGAKSGTMSGAGSGKIYRVVTALVNQKDKGKYDWDFNCRMLTEEDVIRSLSAKQRWLNVEYDNGIKGAGAALSRFEGKQNKPFVIISQLIDSTNRLLGYKVANYDGQVTNIKLKEMLAYGIRVSKADGIPVQNAMFVSGEGKRPYYKAYTERKFITEIIEVKHNPNAQKPAKVEVKKNAKSLNKLNDIYSPQQIQELKAGKQDGLDIRLYANPALSWEQMAELRRGLKKKVNIRPIASPDYSPMLMRGYILDLESGLDIKRYLNPKYTIEQLAEISLAVEEGLDISKLSDINTSAEEMAEIRQRLESKLWSNVSVKADSSWKK